MTNLIEQAIAQHKALKQRISDNVSEQESLLLELDRLKRDQMEAKNRLAGYTHDDFSSQAAPIRQQLDNCTQAISAAEHRLDELRFELETATADLKAFTLVISEQDIADLQTSIQANRDKAGQLKRLIDENMAIYKEDADIDTATPLIDRKIKLLAEVALGSDHSAELAELEPQIKAAQNHDMEANMQHLMVGNSAYHTTKGLEILLAEVNQEIDSQVEAHRYLMDSVLMAMAAKHAQAYQQAADTLLSCMRGLAAVEQLVTQTGIRSESGYLPSESQSLLVPCLGTMAPVNHPRLYVHWVTGQEAMAEDVDSLQQLLKRQGIESTGLYLPMAAA